MKLPQVNPPGAGKPSGSYEPFEFIPHCPEKRNLHYVPTPGGGISASLKPRRIGIFELLRQAAGNSSLKEIDKCL